MPRFLSQIPVFRGLAWFHGRSREKTRAREFKGLVNACKAYKLDKGLIIAYEEEGFFEEDGITIEVVSLVSFLLKNGREDKL